MPQLLLVNPSKRKKSRKAASPAQKRARAKFAAMARSRRKNPIAKKRKSRRTSVSVAAAPRTRARKMTRSARRRRNPGRSLLSKPMSILTPALMGAVGAIAVNTIIDKLPLPDSMTTGNAKYLTQAAAAIGLSMLARKLGVRGAMATQMAEGSLTVTLHDAIKDVANQAGMTLSGLNMYLPGYPAQLPSGTAAARQMSGMRGVGQYLTGPGAGGSNVTSITANSGMRGFGF